MSKPDDGKDAIERASPETFGQTLKRIRGARTQREVATRIGMDFSYYSRLEGDRVSPNRDTVLTLSNGLGATEDQRNELLAAAGRVREEMHEKPLLRSLYKAAAQLTEHDLADLVENAEKRLRDREGE